MGFLNAVLTIAYRDFTKLIRDRTRLVFTLIFPVIFIGVLGNSLQSNLGDEAGYNFLAFTFTGVIAQIMFQTTASGVISLLEDRENDFAQEMFIAPVSRYSIIVGKIIGETTVALVQGVAVVIFALLLGVEFSTAQIIQIAPALLITALMGGAFGIIFMSLLSDQRTANQIFPLLIFPQYFLAGVFAPIKELPTLLLLASRIAPLTYAVDLVRNAFYLGDPVEPLIVINSGAVNLTVMIGMFVVFITVGTFLFVRNERNR